MSLPELPYAHGASVATGRLRATPEDFVVEEDLGFTPEGAGEHLFIQIRKREQNTDWVAKGLARWADVKPMDVSYAGLKDRMAVTTQWFCVGLPGKPDPDPAGFAVEGAEILAMVRHPRKLRRGVLKGNRFQLRVRELNGDHGAIEARLQQVAAQGVPNYFGPQRFGHGGRNVEKAVALFKGEWKERDRNKRGIYISAARSQLFNEVLAARVATHTWNTLVPGECIMLDGSGSFFKSETVDEALLARLHAFDVHPSGPLWGRGACPCGDEIAALESAAVEKETDLRAGLEAEGLKQERRALRLPVRELSWEFESAGTLTVRFWLPSGSYATAVLREIVASGEGID
jgi:tRNA pseudouridine13 synthase